MLSKKEKKFINEFASDLMCDMCSQLYEDITARSPQYHDFNFTYEMPDSPMIDAVRFNKDKKGNYSVVLISVPAPSELAKQHRSAKFESDFDVDELKMEYVAKFQTTSYSTSSHQEVVRREAGSYQIRDIYNNGDYTAKYVPGKVYTKTVTERHAHTKDNECKRYKFVMEKNVLDKDDVERLKECHQQLAASDKNMDRYNTLGMFKFKEKKEIASYYEDACNSSYELFVHLLAKHYLKYVEKEIELKQAKVDEKQAEMDALNAEISAAAFTAFAYRKERKEKVSNLKSYISDINKEINKIQKELGTFNNIVAAHSLA